MKVGLALKNIIIFGSLFLVVIWFFKQSKPQTLESQDSKPQEYMLNLHSSNYDAQGKVKEAIYAEYWEFNPLLGCSELSNPRVTVYKPNGEVWYLSAKKALAWHPTLADQITKVNLQDGVLIERPETANATPVKLETLALEYIPDQEMITSKEFVSMQQPGLTISGYGLLGYLDRNWIELHDKITTIYTPS